MANDIPAELADFLLPSQGERLRWRFVSTGLGRLVLADAGRGLCFLGWAEAAPDAPSDERGEGGVLALMRWARRFAPGAHLEEDHGGLRGAAEALCAYAEGSRAPFREALDLRGPAFHVAVWRELATVPLGATTTYGELARRLGRDGASRAVGQAVGANPLPIVVPCHRVLARGGALGGFSAGLSRKQQLLALEGHLLAVA